MISVTKSKSPLTTLIIAVIALLAIVVMVVVVVKLLGGEAIIEEQPRAIVDLLADGTIKIGDYISYVPNGETSYSVSSTYSGLGNDQEISQRTMNWRVLDVKNGQVRLISEKPSTDELNFSGYNGYNNSVKLLDDLCNKLYSGDKGKAQSIKVEDITSHIIDFKEISYNPNYNTTYSVSKYKDTDKYYPQILLEEKNQSVVGMLSKTQNSLISGSEQLELIKQIEAARLTDGTIRNTYWYGEISNNAFKTVEDKEDIYHELFMKDMYWLASRCTSATAERASFNVHYVIDGGVSTVNLYDSNNTEYSVSDIWNFNIPVRPIVTLNADVLIDMNNKPDGLTTVDNAWKLK